VHRGYVARSAAGAVTIRTVLFPTDLDFLFRLTCESACLGNSAKTGVKELEDSNHMTITTAARPARRHSCKEASGILVSFRPVLSCYLPGGRGGSRLYLAGKTEQSDTRARVPLFSCYLQERRPGRSLHRCESGRRAVRRGS
jgi:hypothetical protein